MIPKEVFLSHASADGEFASRLAELLRRHGVPVWFSATNLVGGQQWHDEIGAALRRCDWFLIVLSQNAIQSFWVKRELCYVLRQPRFVNCITPVLIQSCDHELFSWTLSAIQVVNFLEAFDGGCRDLLRVWGLGYQPL